MSDETPDARSESDARQFLVQGMTNEGKETRLTISAPSQENAMVRAREQGVFPTSVQEFSGAGNAAPRGGSTTADTHKAARSMGGGGRKVVGAVMIAIGIALLVYFSLLS